ncbi:MAG: FAD-binding oxidoreductase, partial [Gammaproteobacteria bacterium]|nr:FAD-binding oxidoreductase [Gammaproteobacteria bacterium]
NQVVLFADTFNTYFEPENVRAAKTVLEAGGYEVHFPRLDNETRPLCCGRTYLAVGLVDEAKREMLRTLEALRPYVDAGVSVVGLEPSCLLTMRDELQALVPSKDADALAQRAVLFEEFLASEHDNGKLSLPLQPIPNGRALLHGHCHQKAFGAMSAVHKSLSLVPDLEVETVTSSCCGMAGAFGYQAENFDVSMQMGEASLLPAVRGAEPKTLIVADGTSCRHQIADGTEREAIHVARLLEQALSQ